eukprot:GHVS01019157.1.p1 GENE.GHVS01019157.1~~GHVS01019157.1.p1  ORF type:complete len:440 (+),score=129.02 GHVS01019157.1:218-1537(+)
MDSSNNRRSPPPSSSSSPSHRPPLGLLRVRKSPPFTNSPSVFYRQLTPGEAAAAAAIRREEQGTTSRSPAAHYAIASSACPSPTAFNHQRAAGFSSPQTTSPQQQQQQPPEQQQHHPTNTSTVAVGGCTQVESSLSHIGDMVDLLSSEVFVMAQELLTAAEGYVGTDGGGQCRNTPRLEKARLSLEVNVNELSEDLDEVRVKSLLPLYSHIKKLIHGRLDLLELYTKHRLAQLIIHNSTSTTSSSSICWYSSVNCSYSGNSGGGGSVLTLNIISELEDRTVSLAADIQKTFSNSLPPPLLSNNICNNNSPSSINWPDSVCTALRAKQRYWLQQVNSICLDVDEFALSITSKDDSPTPINLKVDEESLVVKELGCRKRSLYAKLDIIETLVQSMKFPTAGLLLSGSSMVDSSISEWSCSWWMLGESTRPILEARLYNNNN